MVDCSTKAKRVFLTCFFSVVVREVAIFFFMVSENLRIVEFFFVGRGGGVNADMEVTDPFPTGYGTRFFFIRNQESSDLHRPPHRQIGDREQYSMLPL